MVQALKRRGINAGRHGIAGLTSHESSGALLTLNNFDNRFVNLPAGWSQFDQNNAFGGTLILNSTTTNPITFTPDTQTDTIDIYYYANTGYNTFTVNNGASLIGTAVTSPVGVTKLSCPTTLGTNTYTIQRSATGTSAIILAVEAYNSSAKEITCINMGFGSGLIDTWFAKAPTQNWHNVNVLLNAAYKPDLIVINYGINHWANYATQTLSAFTAALNYIVNQLVTGNIPVLLIVPPYSPSSVVSSDIQKTYMDAIKSVAASYGVAYFDSSSLFIDNASAIADGYMANGDVHPYPVGYNLQAEAIAKFIEYLINV